MSCFRLKVDLSDFFKDYRCQAYTIIKSDWKTVECLENHVQKLFNLPKIYFLTGESVYLPSVETIDIINQGDVLKVIPAEDQGSEINNQVKLAKKAKKNKKAKEKSEQINFPAPGVLSNTEKAAIFETSGVDADLDSSKGTNCSNPVDSSKSKRKRKRKSKKLASAAEAPVFVKPSPPLVSESVITAKTNGHIRFHDDGAPIEDTPAKEKDQRFIFVSALDDLDMQPRIVRKIEKPKEYSDDGLEKSMRHKNEDEELPNEGKLNENGVKVNGFNKTNMNDDSPQGKNGDGDEMQIKETAGINELN